MSPFLSIVVTSRNDSHGGDIQRRMRHCFANLAHQTARAGIPAELVVVEWNPPPDRPPLAQSGVFPPVGAGLPIRVVTVPPEHHRSLPNADQLPLYQYLAKNVGLRRARGEFVLCTNVDVMMSDALAETLRPGMLDADLVYRCDRWDVDFAEIGPDIPEEERQNLCRQRLTKLNLRYAAHAADTLDGVNQGDIARIAAAGAARDAERQRAERIASRWHFNASGDFTLLARTDWDRLRGYPEWPIHSWSLDSIFLARAETRGLAERHLGADRPLFHIDHDLGWTASGFNFEGLSFRVDRDGPDVDGVERARIMPAWHRLPLLTLVDAMRMKQAFVADPLLEYNDHSWGLIGVNLPEATLS